MTESWQDCWAGGQLDLLNKKNKFTSLASTQCWSKDRHASDAHCVTLLNVWSQECAVLLQRWSFYDPGHAITSSDTCAQLNLLWLSSSTPASLSPDCDNAHSAVTYVFSTRLYSVNLCLRQGEPVCARGETNTGHWCETLIWVTDVRS